MRRCSANTSASKSSNSATAQPVTIRTFAVSVVVSCSMALLIQTIVRSRGLHPSPIYFGGKVFPGLFAKRDRLRFACHVPSNARPRTTHCRDSLQLYSGCSNHETFLLVRVNVKPIELQATGFFLGKECRSSALLDPHLCRPNHDAVVDAVSEIGLSLDNSSDSSL